jgi:hypothetical protein
MLHLTISKNKPYKQAGIFFKRWKVLSNNVHESNFQENCFVFFLTDETKQPDNCVQTSRRIERA